MSTERTIQPEGTGLRTYLGRVWAYRRLIGVFAWRDIRAQYAQTLLGVFWAVIKPLMALAIFTIFFGVLVPLDSKIKVEYPLFAFSGMVAWYFFTYLITNVGTSVVNAQQLISRVYFPKLILPLAKTFAGMADFCISMVLMVILMMIWGHVPGWEIAFFPLILGLNILVGLGMGLWLSALTSRYRDFHHLLPYLVNFAIWLTPVFYPTTIIPEKYQAFLYANPMAGVIAGFRWTLLGDDVPDARYLYGMIPMVLIFFVGVVFFYRVERLMVDKV
ncbi:MAG: ABC transporter permease [Bacteroidetes bacterium]|jgi:lipopolysaccharide transport system permease protein|nr:ABC transporter permease [Bacteroidota bacterium]MBP6639090.1 ABC transporter permease [Bacteroidia bacterium]MBP6722496.1 ABC transporter permease [Bacteroidia bacterium]